MKKLGPILLFLFFMSIISSPLIFALEDIEYNYAGARISEIKTFDFYLFGDDYDILPRYEKFTNGKFEMIIDKNNIDNFEKYCFLNSIGGFSISFIPKREKLMSFYGICNEVLANNEEYRSIIKDINAVCFDGKVVNEISFKEYQTNKNIHLMGFYINTHDPDKNSFYDGYFLYHNYYSDAKVKITTDKDSIKIEQLDYYSEINKYNEREKIEEFLVECFKKYYWTLKNCKYCDNADYDIVITAYPLVSWPLYMISLTDIHDKSNLNHQFQSNLNNKDESYIKHFIFIELNDLKAEKSLSIFTHYNLIEFTPSDFRDKTHLFQSYFLMQKNEEEYMGYDKHVFIGYLWGRLGYTKTALDYNNIIFENPSPKDFVNLRIDKSSELDSIENFLDKSEELINYMNKEKFFFFPYSTNDRQPGKEELERLQKEIILQKATLVQQRRYLDSLERKDNYWLQSIGVIVALVLGGLSWLMSKSTDKKIKAVKESFKNQQTIIKVYRLRSSYKKSTKKLKKL